MNVEITPADLLNVGGVAAATWVVLQFIKGWIKVSVREARYPLVMNTASALLGIVWALLGQAILGLTYESIITAILVGLGGALMAIGANEAGGSVKKAVNGNV